MAVITYVSESATPTIRGKITAKTRPRLSICHRPCMRFASAQVNGCGFCVYMHTKDAAHARETPARLTLVAAWREV